MKSQITKSEILAKLKMLKDDFEKEGVVLLGLFGSYARDDYDKNSDIDILYEIKEPKKFVQKYGAFGSFERLLEIKRILKDNFELDVDLVAKSSLNQIAKKYIYKDFISV